MAYKFNTGVEMEYFEKIFENEDVMIYKLKWGRQAGKILEGGCKVTDSGLLRKVRGIENVG